MSSQEILFEKILKNLKFIYNVLDSNHHKNSMEKMEEMFRDIPKLLDDKIYKNKK